MLQCFCDPSSLPEPFFLCFSLCVMCLFISQMTVNIFLLSLLSKSWQSVIIERTCFKRFAVFDLMGVLAIIKQLWLWKRLHGSRCDFHFSAATFQASFAVKSSVTSWESQKSPGCCWVMHECGLTACTRKKLSCLISLNQVRSSVRGCVATETFLKLIRLSKQAIKAAKTSVCPEGSAC